MCTSITSAICVWVRAAPGPLRGSRHGVTHPDQLGLEAVLQGFPDGRAPCTPHTHTHTHTRPAPSAPSHHRGLTSHVLAKRTLHLCRHTQTHTHTRTAACVRPSSLCFCLCVAHVRMQVCMCVCRYVRTLYVCMYVPVRCTLSSVTTSATKTLLCSITSTSSSTCTARTQTHVKSTYTRTRARTCKHREHIHTHAFSIGGTAPPT
jgi:hypothetical protein